VFVCLNTFLRSLEIKSRQIYIYSIKVWLLRGRQKEEKKIKNKPRGGNLYFGFDLCVCIFYNLILKIKVKGKDKRFNKKKCTPLFVSSARLVSCTKLDSADSLLLLPLHRLTILNSEAITMPPSQRSKRECKK